MSVDELYTLSPALRDVVQQTGHHDTRSLMLLHYIVANIKPYFVLELGTGFCASTVFMALATDGKIISVDDYRGDMASDIYVTQSNIEKCGVSDKVELINGDSREILISRNPEIAFMDASHNDDDLRKEFQRLQKILTKDHVLIVDDIYSESIDRFISGLYAKYEVCFILPLHNGMAVLITSVDKYLSGITSAINKAFTNV